MDWVFFYNLELARFLENIFMINNGIDYIGAGEEIRTLDIYLGKVTLYP